MPINESIQDAGKENNLYKLFKFPQIRGRLRKFAIYTITTFHRKIRERNKNKTN